MAHIGMREDHDACGMPKLVLQSADLAPVDQLLWSVWGFCVLEAFPEAELCLDEQVVDDELLGFLSDLSASCKVRLNTYSAVEPKPNENFGVVSSAGVVSQRLLGAVSTLHVYPNTNTGPDVLAPDRFWDAELMPRFRQRALALAGKLPDRAARTQVQARLDGLAESRRPVSLISSVFKADRFLGHFLKNCAELVGYRDIEHWLIRPGSPGGEHVALLDHARCWPGAIYLNLKHDPGLYETWNLGCCLSQGGMISSANVDDRRHPEQVSRLSSALADNRWADLASCALRVTDVANQDWDDWAAGEVFYAEDTEGEYGSQDLIRHVKDKPTPRNLPHCMPVWRRSLHGLHGFFNEQQYGPSADWEFWLRCAEAGSRYYRTPEPLGLYLKREDSFWRRDPAARRFDERVLARYGAAHSVSGSRQWPFAFAPLGRSDSFFSDRELVQRMAKPGPFGGHAGHSGRTGSLSTNRGRLCRAILRPADGCGRSAHHAAWGCRGRDVRASATIDR